MTMTRTASAIPPAGDQPSTIPATTMMSGLDDSSTVTTVRVLAVEQPGPAERRGPQPLEHPVAPLEAGGDPEADHGGRHHRQGQHPGHQEVERMLAGVERGRLPEEDQDADGHAHVTSRPSPRRSVLRSICRLRRPTPRSRDRPSSPAVDGSVVTLRKTSSSEAPPAPQVANSDAVVPQPGREGGHQLRAGGGVDRRTPPSRLRRRGRRQEQGSRPAPTVSMPGVGRGRVSPRRRRRGSARRGRPAPRCDRRR